MFGYNNLRFKVILSLWKGVADASKVLKFKTFVLRTLKKLQVRRRKLQMVLFGQSL